MSEIRSFAFPRSESLKSKTVIARTFSDGQKIKAWPLVLRHLDAELPQPVPCQVLFSVSKRSFKRAVDRNRIKRLLRECWRLQKAPLLAQWKAHETQKAIVFIFMGKEIPTFESLEKAMAAAIHKLSAESPSESPNPVA